jgi:hypothetical protein
MTVAIFIGLPSAKPHTVCGRSADQDHDLPRCRSRSHISWS